MLMLSLSSLSRRLVLSMSTLGMAAGSLLGLLFTWLTLGGAQPSRHKQPSPETDALQAGRSGCDSRSQVAL